MEDNAVGGPELEVWAGFECTVNRVGAAFIDQLALSGHDRRSEDLELLSELGVRTVRYPVLWERTAPRAPDRTDWSWADERLARLRELRIRPIVGLVHHGSGPRYTSLIDPGFADGLARHAGEVAERYPWLEAFTPVNEPLTTARFSGLYGHWYPHGRDDRTFLRALLNECRATVLAMRAIRAVNPAAWLVQTEDLGKTHGTQRLAYQAEFENERRWLSFDLLSGRVDRQHPLWSYLLSGGIAERELGWFREHPCPPDVLGINHYLSSERFLDERLEQYPANSQGGNWQEAYADVLAARACAEGPVGPRVLLDETWERYKLPIAVTEVHNGCTREEQLRWLQEVWESALAARGAGVDVRAVTAWSLLGAFGWDELVRRADGRYEPGVYDLRGSRPRPTALAGMLKELAAGGDYDHPVLDAAGWWRRPDRLSYPPAACSIHRPVWVVSRVGSGKLQADHRRRVAGADTRRLAITGATGTLGRAFARICEQRGLPYELLSRRELEIAEPASAARYLEARAPWAVINTAGYVRVDDAEREPERCRRENATGPAVLASACAARGIPLVTFSSDLVFDGSSQRPYVESDPVNPLNVYGQTKAEAEARVLELHSAALVIRTSAFFGPWDVHNFVLLALRVLGAGETFVAAEDSIVSPTYVPDLVQASLDLLIDGEQGIWHLANVGAVSWFELAARAAELAGIGRARLVGQPLAALGLEAPRPRYSALSSERGLLLPSLEESLTQYFQEREQSEPALATLHEA